MIPVPTKKAVLFLITTIPLFILGFFAPLFWYLAFAIDAVFVIFMTIEYTQARRDIKIEIEALPKKVFSIGRENSLILRVCNHSKAQLDLQVKLDLPISWTVIKDPGFVSLGSEQTKELRVVIKPLRRGVFPVDFVHWQVETSSGFLHIYDKHILDIQVDVLPDVKQISRFLKMTRQNRLAEMGIHKNIYLGTGTNWESLREYQKDDDFKRIDWKASTRVNKIVSKVFQFERNSMIYLVIDCGRLMVAEQEGLNSLDYAVNGALILAVSAQKFGDSVAVIAFNNRIIDHLPPTRGKNMLGRITRFLSKLKPDFVESNYEMVFEYIKSKVKRRALVIFFSDIIDDVNYQIFSKYFSILGKKHVLLYLLIRDTMLMKCAEIEPIQAEDPFTSAAAADLFLKREEMIKKLKQKRINLLNVMPHEVTPTLVNKYLELKAKSFI